MYSFGKIKINDGKILQRSNKSSENNINGWIKQKKIIKLSDRQLKQLKISVKIKTGITLRMSFKMLDGNDLTHELLLTTRQKTKLKNAFNNNKSTDLKLSKAQIF